MKYDICIIGGFGHVGLPLSIAFAQKGLKVCAFDISKEMYNIISTGKMPFMEEGSEELLQKVLMSNNLILSLDPESISKSHTVIITIGTPVDSHLSPQLNVLESTIIDYFKYFKEEQLIILRSTIYPNTTRKIHRLFENKGKKIYLAFCPERIVQGHAIKELSSLPQMVSSTSEEGLSKAVALFKNLTNDIVIAKPEEAELAKLFSNTWRYIKFAAANQLFILSNEAGVDFYSVYKIMTHNYERTTDMPVAGFASGPCLYKDTVQLNSFNNNNFPLGSSAIMVNEGLPFYIFNKIKQKYDLKSKSVGILGMAFKSDIDDKRDSLSYKLKELFEFEAKKVYCSDLYIKDENFVTAEELVNAADIIILATPHKEYAKLRISEKKILVDIWNLYKRGCLI
jgi:UDP-N-acetyl-D-mannosaminuronic acid dehydrogenase